MKIKSKELDSIVGGTSITAPFINAFTKIVEVLVDAGRGVGSSIRRFHDGEICPLK